VRQPVHSPAPDHRGRCAGHHRRGGLRAGAAGTGRCPWPLPHRPLGACRERGLGFTPYTWTNGLGFIINLHVYAAGPRDYPIEYPYEPPGWVPEARDGLLTESIRVDADGTVAVPDASGLGIVINEDKLAHYGERYFEVTSRGIAVKTTREKGLFTALRLARKRRR